MSFAVPIAITLLLGLAAWLLFLWSVKSGQYDDPEGPKYRMLEDDEEGPGTSIERPRDPGDLAEGARDRPR